MRARTRKHPTKQEASLIKEEKSISASKFLDETFEDLPRGAVSLAGLRYRENMTQKELGELIGVKQGNISQMERGLRPIGKNMAKTFAKVFKTDYRIFL